MCNELIYPEYIIYGVIYGPLAGTAFNQLITVIEKYSVHSEDSFTKTVHGCS